MKRITDSKKVEMVLSSFQDGVVITEHCKKYGVSRSTFYRYKSLVMGAILTVMVRKKHPEKLNSPAKRSIKKPYRCRIK